MAQFFGDAAPCDITIGGVAYALAVRFWGPSTQAPGLSQPPEPEVICTGVVQSSEELGGGLVRCVMQRALQTLFYVLPPNGPGQSAITVPYYCNMGGNVCETREWHRGYSPFNETMARRGSMMANRVVVGDGCQVVRTRRTLPAMVTRADAHGHAPAVVNYSPGEVLPALRYLEARLYTIRASASGAEVQWINRTGQDVTEGTVIETAEWSGVAAEDIDAGDQGAVAVDLAATVEFDGSNAGVYPSSLVIYDGSTGTIATRRIFTPPGGSTPDHSYLPENVGGAGFDGVDYWWDEGALAVRLSSFCATAGDEAELVYWLRTLEPVPGQVISNEAVVVGTGTGPGSTVDSVVFSGWDVGGDFQQEFLIETGVGAVEWRQTTAGNARRLTIELGPSGPTQVTARLTTGAAEAVTIPDPVPSYSLPYRVRITKVGGVYTAESRQDGSESWQELAEVTLTGIVANNDGMVGVLSWGGEPIRASGVGSGIVTRELHQINAEGSHAVLRTSGRVAFTVSGDTGLSATGLAEVFNLTTGQAMTLGSAVRRDQYRVIDGTLWIVAENSGDNWRVTYAPTGDPPEAPGRAPRGVADQGARGWAEIASGENPDFTASTNVAANIANWHDVVEVLFEDGTVPVPGETLEFVRWGVWDPENPPDLFSSARNGPVEPWQPLVPGTFRAFYFAGLLLMTREWYEAFGAGLRACFMGDGQVFIGTALSDAAQYNELRDAARGADNLWIELPRGGGRVTVRGGELYQTAGVVTRNEANQPTSLGIGADVNDYSDGNPPTTPPGLGQRPFWDAVPALSSTAFADSILRNGFVWDGLGLPRIIPGDGEIIVWPEEGGWYSGSPVLYMGQSLELNNAFPIDYLGARFAVRGFAFNFEGELTRLPDAADILEAWIEVTATGLEEHVWTFAQDDGPGLAFSRFETWNGVTVVDVEIDSDGNLVRSVIVTDAPRYLPGASISFDLIGKRYNTANVVTWAGEVLTVRADEYVSAGGGIGATRVENGVKTLVQCTGAIQGLAELRSSKTGHDSHELWPSLGVAPSGPAEALAGVLRGLQPQASFTLLGTPENFGTRLTMAGKMVRYTNLELGRVLIRTRSGLTGHIPRPLVTPPAI